MIYHINMSKEKEGFKALMVKASTHKKVVVKAKQSEQTVDTFINNLLKGNDK